MKEAIVAALAPGARRLLLVEPPPSLVLSIAARVESRLVVVVSARRRRLRRCGAALVAERPLARVVLLRTCLEGLPLAAGCVDVLILAAGLPPLGEPLSSLEAARRLLRPGGAVMVVSRLREGPVGSVSSLVERVRQRRGLPLGSDLSAWMLLAGLRRVRQASLPRAPTPTVVTWAEARPRPWEGATSSR